MPRKKQNPNEVPLPQIDGDPEQRLFYYTRNSRVDEETILSKDEMRELFKNRFGYYPDKVFYGQPNGSLIYAGPLTRTPSPEESNATDPGDLQPTLL